MMRKFVCLVVIGLILTVIAPVGGSPEKEKVAVASAERWLGLVDQGKYAESWNEAASLFRNAVNQGQWEQSVQAVRKPLGKLITRKTKTKTYRTSLPGLRMGNMW
jgi:hypothetical protein